MTDWKLELLEDMKKDVQIEVSATFEYLIEDGFTLEDQEADTKQQGAFLIQSIQGHLDRKLSQALTKAYIQGRGDSVKEHKIKDQLQKEKS